MHSHVKILAVLQIVFGSLGLVIGLGIFALFGGIAGLVGITDHSGDALVAIPILGAIGTFILVLLAVLSLPGIIAGVGLLSYRPWARILTIILSVFHLLNFPFGTALGFYGMWVLLSPEGAAIFNPRPQYSR
jgi:hypothetical protein